MNILKAIEISRAAHWQHDPVNFEHAIAVARRVTLDQRATDIHCAIAYLCNIGWTARITGADLIVMGIPARVVRGIRRLEYRDDEPFVDYLQRLKECSDSALVAYHDFEQRLSLVDRAANGDKLVRRFRRAAYELNESIKMGCPRSNA